MDGPQPTLYQDWQTRHGRLVQFGAPTWRHLDFQRPVLEFLIKRYAGDSVAQKPALFPLPSPFVLQKRTMVVQHHIAKGLNWHIRDENDARKKTSTILERMKARNARADVSTPGQGKEWPTGEVVLPIEWGAFKGIVFDYDRDFAKVLPQDQQRFLNSAYNTLLKEAKCAEYAWVARKILSKENPVEIVDFLAMLWRDRFRPETQVVTELQWFEERLQISPHRERVLNHLRGALDASDAIVRFAAMRLLEKLGTLDDIGLLADLHALPPEAIPDETERERLAQAMQKLSGLEKA